MPRLEAVLARSRLLLAARIARNVAVSLRALLQVEAGQDSSWVRLLSGTQRTSAVFSRDT